MTASASTASSRRPIMGRFYQSWGLGGALKQRCRRSGKSLRPKAKQIPRLRSLRGTDRKVEMTDWVNAKTDWESLGQDDGVKEAPGFRGCFGAC